MLGPSQTNVSELKWLPFPLDLWIPAGLKDFQEAWFVNLLRASLRSDNMGYLILCEEGCGGCSACLWRVANAHHPEHFKKHGSLVLACFNSAQIAGRRVLYFPRLVETLKKQLSRVRNHRSRTAVLSEISTTINREGGVCSPSESLFLDFDLKSKEKDQNLNSGDIGKENPMKPGERLHPRWSTDLEECPKRILQVLGLPEVSLAAATAAVRMVAGRYDISANGVVQHIWTEAKNAAQRGVSNEDFLDDLLAQECARGILDAVNLPVTNNRVFRVAAVVKAEAKEIALSLKDTAAHITDAAVEDKRKGTRIDIFYFEDMRWRSNAGTSKAEQRKLNNIAANARAKEILRRQLF
jgi:hypothetical protein